ncbi:MAG: hypothetical protein HFG41_03715 [Coprococcus sp.]|nr:hypothetical protein [Coprococcus sp.]
MKNRTKKIITMALTAVFLLSAAGTAIYTRAAEEKKDKKETAQETKAETTGKKAAANTASAGASKDESVYVLTGSDGSVQEIIVSDWIKNAAGGDTYSQDRIEKELPVEMAVTYKLDGKKVSPAELAGKSGKVSIRFDYTNKQSIDTEIDGKKEKIYVPFAMLTGMILDNETFTNVEVSNGKLVNDGTRTIVVGIAFPGMQENLAIAAEKFEIPNYVEITADAKDFELGMTATLATNEIFNETDTDDINSVEDLKASLDQMTDAMDQLMDGSSQLYDGLDTLLSKSGELVEGVDKLAEGAKTLEGGAGSLDEGASRLQEGAVQLYAGLSTLASNSNTLNSGARQVFDTLLSTANTQLAAAGLDVPAMTIQNYAGVLDGVIASLDENAVYNQALEVVKGKVEEQRPYITEQVTAAVGEQVRVQVTASVQENVRAQVEETVREGVVLQVLQAAGIEKEVYDAAIAAGALDEQIQAVQAAIEEQMSSESVAQMIDANTASQMESGDVQGIIDANVEGQMQSDAIKSMIETNTEAQVQAAISAAMAGDEVQSQLAAASEGAKSVIALRASLDSYNAFYLGLKSYTDGVSQALAGAGELKAGTDTLKNGSGQLYAGASELSNGLQTLKSSTPALTDGVSQLRDGALQLSDGLKEFNEKGVEKLVEAVDGDVESLISRVRATVDTSKNYKLFTDDGEGIDGQVKFIYRTDSIEAEK